MSKELTIRASAIRMFDGGIRIHDKKTGILPY